MEHRPDDDSVARWYVVHTYSGYENKVKHNLEKTIDNRGLQDRIVEISIPTEEVAEFKDGKRRTVQQKLFPGYVMVKMIMDDEMWYIVRNTRGVTGFVGQPPKNISLGGAADKDASYDHRRPVPLTDEEVTSIGIERLPIKLDLEIGENVRVVSGPLENFVGSVVSFDTDQQKVKLVVEMFGRKTPVELDFIEVQKLRD